MPRAKKKKVEVINQFLHDISKAGANTTAMEKVSSSTVAEQDMETYEDPLEAEAKQLQKEMMECIKKARVNVREATVDVRKAEASLRHEQRLSEERDKRWWAAERRKEPPPAHLQLASGATRR